MSGCPSINDIPPGSFEGLRAMNVQFYDESNRKLGQQWGASRRLSPTTAGGKYYSILKTRTLPLDLKARIFSYTGDGIIARFWTGFPSVTLPTPEPVYSKRPAMTAFRDFDLYALSAAPSNPLTWTKWSEDLFLEGSASNQNKGIVTVSAGQGWIIDPNQEILLEIESLSAQNITATLAMFNGLLDLPRP